MRQILTPSGDLIGAAPLGTALIVRLYRAMVFARVFDRKCVALQKQGRLATYSPFEGQEAAQVGSAAALEADDWMVASYRDGAAMWMQGYPMELLIAGRTGHEAGGSPPVPVPVLPPSITVGAHMLHAVGLAWASRLLGEDRISITYFGDGATSEGDFHEAMNFAGVFSVGTVFLCQNNGWAISMPRSGQTASESIAQKAVAYGVPGVQVDGNDLFAVYETTLEAVDRARRGEGPTLIEAVTYRVGPHTTADDPTRYREQSEPADWLRRDPLERVRLFLAEREAWSDDLQSEVEAQATNAVEEAVQRAEALPAPTPAHLFDAMFHTPPPHLAEQRAALEIFRAAQAD